MALPDDWSYLLAESFLDAAVSCGAECSRRFVTPGVGPEGLPPDCLCQLVATVEEGFERPPGARRGSCAVGVVASVTLTLDLCVPAAGQTEVPDPVRWGTAARDAARTRGLMMKGLRTAWVAGRLCPGLEGPPEFTGCGCGAVTPAPWRAVRQDWGSSRWATTWTWREDVA